jgi:hypothetical protein
MSVNSFHLRLGAINYRSALYPVMTTRLAYFAMTRAASRPMPPRDVPVISTVQTGKGRPQVVRYFNSPPTILSSDFTRKLRADLVRSGTEFELGRHEGELLNMDMKLSPHLLYICLCILYSCPGLNNERASSLPGRN